MYPVTFETRSACLFYPKVQWKLLFILSADVWLVTTVTNTINDDHIPLKYASKPVSRCAGTGTPDWNETSF